MPRPISCPVIAVWSQVSALGLSKPLIILWYLLGNSRGLNSYVLEEPVLKFLKGRG